MEYLSPYGWIKIFGDAGIKNGMQQQQNYDSAYASANSNRQPGMQYDSAPQPGSGGGIHVADNVARLGGWADAKTLESMPQTSKGGAAEAHMGDSPQAVGGFAVEPTQVDSSQQSGINSAMVNYLNYMKYRGGY